LQLIPICIIHYFNGTLTINVNLLRFIEEIVADALRCRSIERSNTFIQVCYEVTIIIIYIVVVAAICSIAKLF
jgi:hypothetical protein